MLLLLSSLVEAGDTVKVDYTPRDGLNFTREIEGWRAAFGRSPTKRLRPLMTRLRTH